MGVRFHEPCGFMRREISGNVISQTLGYHETWDFMSREISQA